MKKIRKFEDFECWQMSRDLVSEIYKIVESSSKLSKDYGLKDQIQRAAVSVMSNIAEGFDRYSNKEFIQFLVISRSSLSEVKSLLYVIADLEMLRIKERDDLFIKITEIMKKINALISYLRKSTNKPVKPVD